MAILFCSMTFADDTENIRPRNDRYEESAGESGQVLTDELKTKVAAILSKYDAASLTEADAKAINNAFRESGVRRGPGQKEAIEAAGFDPRIISSLDPPPDRKQNSDSERKTRPNE